MTYGDSEPTISAAKRALDIEYAIRDVVVPAMELEKQGHEIIKLNIGDPLEYEGLPTPEHMNEAYRQALTEQRNGYSPSYGIPELRSAIAEEETSKGWVCMEDDVYVCTGVTEALQILFAASLEAGEKVLAPGPHYPPYMTYPPLFGAKTVEYRLDPDDNWNPDFDDIASKMDDSVKLLVIINPNNPTGGIASKEMLEKMIELTEQWPQCTIVADEIYDALNFDGDHHSCAAVASRMSSRVPIITLNGVSKNFFAPGWRIGYLAIYDPSGRFVQVRDGIERLLRARLCASTPAQYGYLAGLRGDRSWLQGYRDKVLQRRDYCLERIAEIDGIESATPGGAFYLFPRLTHAAVEDDKRFVLDLLHQEKVLLVHGSGFSPTLGKGFVRIVYLANLEILKEAFDRIERFLRNL